MAPLTPINSPASATCRMMLLPSAEVMVSFTRPLHSKYTPRGTWPSTKRTALAGYELVNFTSSKDFRAGEDSWQKKPSFFHAQDAQLSTISRPYGAGMLVLLFCFLGGVSFC